MNYLIDQGILSVAISTSSSNEKMKKGKRIESLLSFIGLNRSKKKQSCIMLLNLNLLGGCKYKMYKMTTILYYHPPSKFKFYNMTLNIKYACYICNLTIGCLVTDRIRSKCEVHLL